MSADSTVSPVARQISLNAIVQALLVGGAMSRADLAKRSGLSKQTASEVVRGLQDEGWLLQQGRTSGKPGRSAITYEINARAALAAAIDLGGTKVAAVIGDLRGNMLAEDQVPTDLRGGSTLVEQVSSLVHSLLERAGASRSALKIAVLGTPGVFEAASGHIDIAPNVPGFNQINVRALLAERLGAPVLIENDVNLAAVGERWRGRGAGLKNFCFIALGTGIGMGIIAGGELVRGARGAAGEIAYLPIGGDPYDPRGFELGTFESSAGSVAIADRYASFGGAARSTARDVFDAFVRGEQAGRAAIEETARVIAPGIAAVAAVLDPELVILGGSIGIRPELLAEINRCLARCTPWPPRVIISALGGRAALIGGLGLGLEKLHHELFGIDLPGLGFTMPA